MAVIPTQIGHYRIHREIGRGGLGRFVVSSTDEQSSRPVALILNGMSELDP